MQKGEYRMPEFNIMCYGVRKPTSEEVDKIWEVLKSIGVVEMQCVDFNDLRVYVRKENADGTD